MVVVAVDVGELTGMPERTGLFDKTDPYVRIKLGDHVHHTRTFDNAGSRPVEFDQFLTFEDIGDGKLHVEVMDDNVFKDELMAEGDIWLRNDYRGITKFVLKLTPVNKHCKDPTLHVTIDYRD